MTTDPLDTVVEKIRQADALLIGAGAGMGVDSGLPDFRGKEGFWKAYPAFADLGVDFVEMANPAVFQRDPTLAWGFYGHRLKLYRETQPHRGFDVLRSWGENLAHGAFVFTSNIDGHFQRAGFESEQVVECHGSINHLQCTKPCSDDVWSADDISIDVDMTRVRAVGEMPSCPKCGSLARPNVLMFGDWNWISDRSGSQERRLVDWLQQPSMRSLVVIELGAGKAVPTVRATCEGIVRSRGGALVRIKPRDSDVPPGHFSFPSGARTVLEALNERLSQGGYHDG